ncbi:hypothetical protein [Breznakiella homolactica]|uniref:Uncharacterized protein n=1 Tax=Breznakiella homolactica TaxID=2798577 RepID=A0A7T7XNK3_9SPIR|nr:hypothetical protein [Breznakiella homolactica]QQO09517.1 hypothetical protein JFL75_00940 [Breznakiella homolactica]
MKKSSVITPFFVFLMETVTAGIELRLYPVKPVTLRAKFGGQFFENFTMSEIEVQAGIAIKAGELFLGYRRRGLENSGWNGFSGGFRYYF